MTEKLRLADYARMKVLGKDGCVKKPEDHYRDLVIRGLCVISPTPDGYDVILTKKGKKALARYSKERRKRHPRKLEFIGDARVL